MCAHDSNFDRRRFLNREEEEVMTRFFLRQNKVFVFGREKKH